MALITAAEARLAIPELSGTSEDTNLDTVIAAVGRAFARKCGYPPASVGGNPTLESATYTRYLTGRGGRDLTLDVWPATSITSVQDDPVLDFDGSTYLVASTDYAIVDGRILRLKSTATHGSWSKSAGAIKVVFAAGYSTVPDDLKHLARLGVRHWWDLRKIQGRVSQGNGQQDATYRDEDFLPSLVLQGLGAFVLPRAFL